jgi:hypothetical protein
MEKIFIGKVKSEIKKDQCYDPEKDSISILGEKLWMTKHSWDCNWYWGFGYIGNKNLHCHADVFIEKLIWMSKEDVFESSIFKTHDQFWEFKDLLKSAYALKKAAEVYHLGGHCISTKRTKLVVNKRREKSVNADLEKVLNTLWDMLTELSK